MECFRGGLDAGLALITTGSIAADALPRSTAAAAKNESVLRARVMLMTADKCAMNKEEEEELMKKNC